MSRQFAVVRMAGYGLAAGLAGWLIVVGRRPPSDAGTFTPPNQRQRREAIGPVAHLPAVLQRAFRDGPGFEPIPRPGPGEWLTWNREFGQPYERFERSRPGSPDATRPRLYLQPLGPFPPEAGPPLDDVRQFAEAYFAMKVVLLPAAEVDEADSDFRIPRSGGRERWHIDAVSSWLAAHLPDDAYLVVGITLADLADGDCLVGGISGRRERVAVCSFGRFHPRFYNDPPSDDDEALLMRRSGHVLAHETCHLFGLVHCAYFRCVMNGASDRDELDTQPVHLCPVCLRKLHTMIGFDVTARYERLAEFSRQVRWREEATWLTRRLEELQEP